ncbi:MAG: RNA 3'-phosphate cyclase [Nitrospirae bacterium]|nr:MAG: RNA 3'-phosphate cyclase [Nitrospirota bacterium]
MIEIDGSHYSGSGTIVRQAVAFAALTGRAVHVVNARMRRPKPGLRPQHLRVVDAICQLAKGTVEGLHEGSRELVFRPGIGQVSQEERRFCWDIGSAGSTTMLALAVLPVLAFRQASTSVEIRGGLFQDFAPSIFHLQQVLLPLLRRMGLEAEAEMGRPGYVPRGDGILYLTVHPLRQPLRGLSLQEPGIVKRIWGIALSSHLDERRVSRRMAEAAKQVLGGAGYHAEIEERNDTDALQPGAALAVFADLEGTARLGADQAGALRRPAEAIGKHVAKQLLEDLHSGATLDRFAADQIIPFAALAAGESRFAIPTVTEHVGTSAWLAKMFLGAEVRADRWLSIAGVGFHPMPDDAP